MMLSKTFMTEDLPAWHHPRQVPAEQSHAISRDTRAQGSCSTLGAAARHSGEDLKSEISTACCSSQGAAAPPKHEYPVLRRLG